MADENLFDAPLSPAAKKAIGSLAASKTQVHKIQDSLDASDVNLMSSKDELLASIDQNINSIFSRLNASNSNDANGEVLDNMLSLASRKSNALSKKKKGSKNNNLVADLESLKKDLTSANQAQLTAMLYSHKKKINDAVATYNMIIKIIPKMRLALNTFANTIISPDDFTKSSISVAVNKGSIAEVDALRITKKANELLETFDINKNIKNDVLSYLVNGRLFFLVLPMNKELATLLNEAAPALENNGIYKLLESNHFKNLSEKSVLTEGSALTEGEKLELKVFRESFNLKEDADISQMGERIDNFIKEEFLIGDCHALKQDNTIAFEETASYSNFFSPNMEAFGVKQNTANGDSSSGPAINPDEIKGRQKAIVRRVSPANIVPLDFEGSNFGYIHLDVVEIDPDNNVLPVDSGSDVEGMGMLPSSSSAVSNGNILQNIVSSGKDINMNGNGQTRSKNYENSSGSPGLDAVEDARLMFMANAFANKLSKQANLKLLKKNDAFKHAIYNGLALKKLHSNQKLRIVYLKPEEVVYINRGQSIFDNVLFFAKLYIATLITVLLQNVLRGGDQRVVYVEVGMDNNGAHAVQQVIRDMKSKEISSIVNMDLQTVLNIQNQFQDLYIPVVDGEKPIMFESLESLSNKSLDDEFLNWLSNNIFSGMGLPSAYLTEVENVDFAKTLSMQNSRYLRDCIGEQAILSRGYSELIRKIYKLEYNDNVKPTTKKKAKKDLVVEDTALDINQLSINFPAPAALALLNINDQIQNAGNIIDTLSANVDLSDVQEDKRDAVLTVLKAKMIRKYVTSFDWVEFDALVKTAITDFIEGGIERAVASGNAEATAAEEGDDTTDAPPEDDTDADTSLEDLDTDPTEE